MQKVLFTGARGFMAGYAIPELLAHGFQVVGLDNNSKHGDQSKPFEADRNYTFVQGDAKDPTVLRTLLDDCDHFVSAAAMVGGAGFVYEYAQDVYVENELISIAATQAAARAFQEAKLAKITIISTSMVYERASSFPVPESATDELAPPISAYAVQKLASERLALASQQQYGVPYTILRPFNCVGTGSVLPTTGDAGYKVARAHVIPDLIAKIRSGQAPLELLGSGEQRRSFTYGGDIARCIRLSLNAQGATNQILNIGQPVDYSVRELAELLLRKLRPDKAPEIALVPRDEFDVMRNQPDVTATRTALGYVPDTPLSDVLDEMIERL